METKTIITIVVVGLSLIVLYVNYLLSRRIDRKLEERQKNLDALGEKRLRESAVREYLRDVWHTSDETPLIDKRVLVNALQEIKLGDAPPYNISYYTAIDRGAMKLYTITRWAYVDDLIPEKK